MLFDLHMHSHHSYDSVNRIDSIFRTARQRGLSGISITDHESFACIDAAEQASRKYGVYYIPGMEIFTEIGDVIGLFLRHEIRSNRFAEVVAEIRSQAGVIMLPHPLKYTNRLSDQVLENIDVIEIFNARITNPEKNAAAKELALTRGIPITASSDAHFLTEIGRGAVDLGDVTSLEDIRAELLRPGNRKIRTVATPIIYEAASQYIKAVKLRDVKSFQVASRRVLGLLRKPLGKIKRGINRRFG